jgi:hypothetical protein
LKNTSTKFNKIRGEAMKTLEKIIQDNFSPEEESEIRLKAKEKVAAIRLQQVRKSHNKTQKEIEREFRGHLA